MDYIYMMWNYDSDEVMFASHDEASVEEMMYDFMMDDIQNEYGWEYHQHDYAFPRPIEDIVNDIWEWYNEYVGIIIIPVCD